MKQSEDMQLLLVLEAVWRERDNLLTDKLRHIKGRPIKGWCDVGSWLHSSGTLSDISYEIFNQFMTEEASRLYRNDNDYWWPTNDYRRVDWMEDKIKLLREKTKEERSEIENKLYERQTEARLTIGKMIEAGVTRDELANLIDADFCECLYMLQKYGCGLPTLKATIWDERDFLDPDDFWSSVYDALDRRLA